MLCQHCYGTEPETGREKTAKREGEAEEEMEVKRGEVVPRGSAPGVDGKGRESFGVNRRWLQKQQKRKKKQVKQTKRGRKKTSLR